VERGKEGGGMEGGIGRKEGWREGILDVTGEALRLGTLCSQF